MPTPQSVILMALLGATLAIITATFVNPPIPEKPNLEVMERNYDFYMKTRSCADTRMFTINSYNNAIFYEQAKEAYRHSGIKGAFYHVISVIETQLNSEEKAILLLVVTGYAICLFVTVVVLTWFLDILFPCEVDTTPPQQPRRQPPNTTRPVRNQQPQIHNYKPKNTTIKIKTQDAPPAYETV